MKQLTSNEALQRLDNPDNLFNILHKNDFATFGKSENRNKNGSNGIHSPEIRELAITLSNEIGNNEAASIIGCAPATLSEWKSGKTSHDEHNTSSSRGSQRVTETNREKASELAAEKVLESIGLIDTNKLHACNAVELASVAAKLSVIGVKSGPQTSGMVNVNIYVPQLKKDHQFQTIEVINVD